MFQKDLIPQKVLTYIGENHILLEMIVAGVLLLLMVSVFFKLSRMKKEIRQICKQVRRYLDVVLAEETEGELQEEETQEEMLSESEAVDLQQIHTYQRKKEQEPVRQNQRTEADLQSQRDAELLMEVIQDVF